MHHERMDGACPGDNIAKFLDKNNMPESDHVPAWRVKHDVVKPGEEFVSLPTHTASSPSTGKVFPAETHHQRVDQAHPGENVALSMQGLDKNNMPRPGHVMVHTAFGDTTSAAATTAVNSIGGDRPPGVQSTAPRLLMKRSRQTCARSWFPRDKVWRAMLSCLSRPADGDCPQT